MHSTANLTLHLIGIVPGIVAHLHQQYGKRLLFRAYNPELMVFLADPEMGRILFRPSDLEPYGVDFEAAYRAAQVNTERKFLQGDLRINDPGGPFGAIETDGFFASHLMLVDAFWDNPPFDLTGQPIIGMPTRTTLLLGDSAKLPLILMQMQETQRCYHEGPHRLHPGLFVRHNGRFEPYSMGEDFAAPPKKWWQVWKKYRRP